jgi:hypothetical protein
MARPSETLTKSTRICDLPLRDVKKRVKHYQNHLRLELKKKGIRFNPHIWVSDDWFCHDGIPGFAMPFYLFHPRLIAMEKTHIGLVEGATERHRLRLMRHELGHAIDNAFGLRKNKERQAVFGPSNKPYPRRYWPQKHSTRFVNYLGDAYAQSHPDEDFAETFAMWLDPESDWKKRYKNTQAYKKLLFMDQLMSSLIGKKPLLKNRFTVESALKDKRTLAEYYKKKYRHFKLNDFVGVDKIFTKTLAKKKRSKNRTLVHNYLVDHREKLVNQVSQITGEYKYLVNRVINITIKRAESQRWVASKGELMKISSRLIRRNLRTLKKQRLLDFYL